MQDPDWSDLRFALAVGRSGALAGAAKSLGVDDATVSRRLARLEQGLGARLFERVDGRLRPTAAGEAVIARAERVEAEIGALRETVAGADGLVSGSVRLTAAPILANRLLAPATPALLARWPELRLELAADPSNLSLTRREADMALRLARPKAGGAAVIARRVGVLRYGVYAAVDASDVEPWIGYDAAYAHLPPARWIAEQAARPGARLAGLAAIDAETLLEAAAAGLGRTLLPVRVAEADPRLRRLDAPSPPPERELWLLIHRELKGLARIQAVADWIETLLAAG